MNYVRREVEVRGPDIERAVAEGLKKLGLQRSEVVVDVIDEGSRGILGLGSRDAVVIVREITPTGTPEPIKPVEKPTAAPKRETAVPQQPQQQPKPTPKPKQAAPKQPEVEEVVATPVPSPAKRNEAADPADALDEQTMLEQEQALAIEIISQLLEKMNVEAAVSATMSEPDDLTGKRMNIIHINGDDLGVLIGPRGETLGALQYIARLMVGHKLRHRSNFALDIEGYRGRREQALRRLAERMADKVIKRGRALTLEPMPPNERRIIHMTLRNHEQVDTMSVGEGDRRKVRIALKK